MRNSKKKRLKLGLRGKIMFKIFLIIFSLILISCSSTNEELPKVPRKLKAEIEVLHELEAEFSLSNADDVYNGSYYWKSDSGYYRINTYPAITEFSIYWKPYNQQIYTSNLQFYTLPMRIYKIEQGKPWKLYQKFMRFYKKKRIKL